MKNLLLALTVLFVLAMCGASSFAQSVTGVVSARNPYYGNRVVSVCYTSRGITWDEAANLARSRGGSLMPIPNYNNFAWLRNAFGGHLTNTLAWVGIFTSRPTSQYSRWSNVDGSNGDFITSFVPWNNRSSTASKEDRGHFWYDGLLNDISSNSTLPTGFVMVQ